MTQFALIGAAGFVAPRHLKAIHDVGGQLIAAVDPSDSVGVLDRYFPETQFFTEIERFDRFLEKRRHGGHPIDYVAVCSPNYLHDAHVRLALRVRANAICEKPLVISPWNLDALGELEHEYGKKVFAVLQLRSLPAVRELKRKFEEYEGPRVSVELKYLTPRGPWYHHSWKGDPERSGGLATNIGIHFFDLLIWVFGEVEQLEVSERTTQTIAGTLVLKKADVRWRLSLDRRESLQVGGGPQTQAHRLLQVDGELVDLSMGAEDLHSTVYGEILSGHAFGIEDARSAIEMVHRLRT